MAQIHRQNTTSITAVKYARYYVPAQVISTRAIHFSISWSVLNGFTDLHAVW